MSERNGRSQAATVMLGSHRAQDTDRPDIETASDAYARRFAGAAGEWLLERQAAAIGSLLDDLGPGPLRVLDVGGGHGQVAPLLLNRGHSVVVHGSAPSCFRRLDDLRSRHPGRLAAATSSLWQLPFADATFDLVITVRLLGHVTRWHELLAELARVSRRYVIVEFARAATLRFPQSVSDALFSLKQRVEGTTRPFYCYRESALEADFRSHGFEPRGRAAQFAFPMVVHRIARGQTILARAEEGLRMIGVGDAMRSPVLLLAERNGRH